MPIQIGIYKNLVIFGVISVIIVGLYFYINNLKETIDGVKSDLKDTYIALANEKLKSQRYKSSLQSQSKEIELLRVSEKLNLAKLTKWKNKKATIKYHEIVKIREVKSNDCTDIKSVVDAIRDINPNSL